MASASTKKKCDQIHFTDICEENDCIGKQCDKRHPVPCIYFEKFGQCKFGSYCAYKHSIKTEEENTKAKIEELTKEISELKTKNKELMEMLENLEQSNNENVTIRKKKKTGKTKTEKQEGKTLDDIIRENSGVYCEDCEFRGKSLKDLKKHKTTAHTKVIETQTEKLKPERHTLSVYVPMRYDGRYVSQSRNWYKDNLGYLEEVLSVESVWIHGTSLHYNAGEFEKADIEIITEEPWTELWKSETSRKEILRKVQIEETNTKPERLTDIAKLNYKESKELLEVHC